MKNETKAFLIVLSLSILIIVIQIPYRLIL